MRKPKKCRLCQSHRRSTDCNALRHDASFICTLKRGHKGPHVACYVNMVGPHSAASW
jgi:hypothetical protein